MSSNLSRVFGALTRRERTTLIVAASLFALAAIIRGALAVQEHTTFVPVAGGSYTEGVIGQPIALNPIISSNQIDQDMGAIIYSRLSDLLATYDTEDGDRTYNLKLKENLTWDDGEPLTSDDVIFTIKTLQDPEVRSPFMKSWEGIIVERISQLQMQLTLPAPYAFLPGNFRRLPIIPRHIFGSIPAENLRLSSFNLEPVGSGPYRFKEFSKRRDGFITSYHFVVNNRYHGTKPFIKDFYFRFYENEAVLLEAVRFHRVQGFGSLTPPAGIEGFPHITAATFPMARYYAIFFNPINNPILKDRNLRRALSLAIDRNALARDLFGGAVAPVFGPTTSTADTPGADAPPTVDLDEARRLIKALPTKDVKLTLVVPSVDFLKRTAERVAQEWRAAGITEVAVVPVSPRDLSGDVLKTRGYEMILYGNVLENAEDLFPFWHSSQRFYPGLNLALYQNLEVDKLIETVRQTNEGEKRASALARAVSMITNDAPAVFLFSLPYFYIHDDVAQGINPKPMVTPEDRFWDLPQWNVARVRALQPKTK